MRKPIIHNSDIELATHYAPIIFNAAKLGENQVNQWLPASGKSGVLNDILSNKIVLKKNFGNLFNSIKPYYLTGGNLNELPDKEAVKNVINQGNEVLLIINEIDNLKPNLYLNYLNCLSDILKVNPKRVHTAINIVDIDLFKKIIEKSPHNMILVNSIKRIPIISAELLLNYINTNAVKYNNKLSEKLKKEIINYSGGILQLTKQMLRNGTSHDQLFLLKEKGVWSRLPNSYKVVLTKKYQNETLLGEENNTYQEIKELGLANLRVFKENLALHSKDPRKLLIKNFSQIEAEIYRTLTKKPGVVISKDKIAKIIWGDNFEDKYSDWAIDQTMSRFRKKLLKCNIDPENVKTIKGRGYKWL